MKSTSSGKTKTSGKTASTFEKPDFAYPVTVQEDASRAFKDAEKRHDYPRLLRAAIQLTIAGGEIDGKKAIDNIALFDTLGNTLPKPWNTLSYLLEAELLNDIYSADSWQYSRRTLPLDSVPEDPTEWSKDIFAQKILNLCKRATSDLAELNNIPITEISSLLTGKVEDYRDNYPTVASFATLIADQVLDNFINGNSGTIPFGEEPAATPSQKASAEVNALTEKMINLAEKSGNIPCAIEFALRRVEQLQFGQYDYLLSAYEKYKSSPEALRLLARAENYTSSDLNPDDKETLAKRNNRLIDLLTAGIAAFPEAKAKPLAAGSLASLTDRRADASVNNQYLSTDSIKANIKVVNLQQGYVLVYRLPDSFDSYDLSVRKILRNGKQVKAVPFSVNGSGWFTAKTDAVIPPLPYGKYALLISDSDNYSGILKNKENISGTLFCVSDLFPLVSTSRTDDKKQTSSLDKNRLYITDGHTLAPLSGVNVEITSRDGKRKISQTVTGPEGFVTFPTGNYRYTATRGKDRISGDCYAGTYWNGGEGSVNRATVLCDRSVYHPGDTVSFAAIAYNIKDNRTAVSAGEKIEVTLRDANYTEVDTLLLTTDADGRIHGSFGIPRDRLLGSWSISVKNSKDFIGNAHFEVADYKTPTFYVEINGTSPDAVPGDTIRITGRAMTYSGMPVANAKVNFDISYISYWFFNYFSRNNPASYGAQTTTDAQGNFTIDLPTNRLKGTPYARGGYSLSTSVTSSTGETQSAENYLFSIGKAYYFVTSSIPGVEEISGGNITLKAPLRDLTRKDVSLTAKYTLNDAEGKTVLSGEYTTPSLRLNVKSLPSGRYTLNLTYGSDTKASQDIILYRESDSKAPCAIPLWVPRTQYTAAPGQKSIEVKAGTGYPGSPLLCEVSGPDGFLSRSWLDTSRGMTTFKVDVPADNTRYRVTLCGAHDLDAEKKFIEIRPASADNNLKVKVVTFRDKIVPGSQEKWSFKFLYNDKDAPRIPVMAVMTDKALNAIEPFAWSFSPRGYISYPNPASLNYRDIYRQSASFAQYSARERDYATYVTPAYDTYGRPLFEGPDVMYDMMLCRSAAPTNSVKAEYKMSYNSAAVEAPEAVEEVATEDEADEANPAAGALGDGGAISSATRKELGNVRMSDTDHPLAFFRPSLVTDAEGNVSVDFTVPDFNTTWQLQILGYTDALYSALETFDAVSSKPVMVKANLPRYLRTGDSTTLLASLQNNSEETREIRGVIEIFDPETGKTIASTESKPVSLAPGESSNVGISFTAPASAALVGVRCYALSGEYSDGEQQLVSILPSSSPVFESTPFYLGIDNKSAQIKLPKYDKNANVTLQYCDNPVWFCVTALPDIADGSKSSSIFAKLNTLFGNAVADGIARKYPAVRTAIQYWTEALKTGADSTLVSNLEKDQDLKTFSLQNTTWVNDAASESERMQRLSTLLDHKANAAAIKAVTKELLALQKPDGGWSWVPEMKSSTYVTSSVLLNLAMLRDMNMLPTPDLFEEVAVKAVKYVDSELYKDYIKNKKQILPGQAIRWLYIRNYFDVIPADNGIRAMLDKALKSVIDTWKDFDIYDKATAAVLMQRSGKEAVASDILESLRQYATVTPERGMYYANLRSGWNGFGRLITTTQVLEAYDAIAPADPAVDRLRQWLILQRQVEDWGYDPHCAEIVYTILSSGVDWAKTADAPEISIDGKPLSFTSDRITGALTVNLDPAEVSGKTLSVVSKSSGPAWGGVISQYIAPSADVKAAKVDLLSITKEIYSAETGSEGERLSASDLKTGQKVRVVLTVKNDNDLQYVAISDERGACMEPVDQLSSYTCTDGVWTYRETRNSQTDFFIDFLPKGTHILTYDCYIDRAGDYTIGIATAQSLYAPLIVAHSAGVVLKTDSAK